MKNQPFIPKKDFMKIQDLMPICTTDLLITNNGKYLIVKRKQKPALGKWWIPGGRILKNETIKESALRKARQEVGLKCEFVKILGAYDTIFDDGPNGVPIHAVNILCKLKSQENKINLDKNHSKYKWVKSLVGNVDNFLLEALKNVKFKK